MRRPGSAPPAAGQMAARSEASSQSSGAVTPGSARGSHSSARAAGSGRIDVGDGAPSTPRSSRLGVGGYYSLAKEGYEELVKCIVRPPRAEYSLAELGPSRFSYGGVDFERVDCEMRNARGLRLVGSLWRHADDGAGGEWPCVVYMHGNASCRAEALTILAPILAQGARLFAFDFAGCGMSEGDYISLGWFERDDVALAIEWVRAAGAGAVALWGRSMGAASAVMHTARDPTVAGIVLDSPFASLEQIALELVADAGQRFEGVPNFPSFLVKGALRMVASSVKSRAGFDLYKVRPIDYASTCYAAALFGTGLEDALVRPHHSKQIADAYAGDKNLVSFGGDHNELRPGFFIDSACIFLKQVLLLPDDKALAVPVDEDGRPLPLHLALRQTSVARLPGVRSSSASSMQAAEAEMLRQAIEASLMPAAGAEAAAPRGQARYQAALSGFSSLTGNAAARIAPNAAGVGVDATDRGANGGGGGDDDVGIEASDGSLDGFDSEETMLAHAIQMSLLDAETGGRT